MVFFKQTIADNTHLIFLKVVLHKFYLVYSLILCPIYNINE